MTALPDILPVFPLMGAILQPRQVLPLLIFEPRYLAMARAAYTSDQMIGLIQPKLSMSQIFKGIVELEQVGGAGRIVRYQETQDGRISLVLEGVSRFQIAEELALVDGYRRVRANYAPFEADLIGDRESLESTQVAFALRRDLEKIGLTLNWKEIHKVEGEMLLNFLSFRLPLLPNMKQELLESMTLKHRLELLQLFAHQLAEVVDARSTTLQ